MSSNWQKLQKKLKRSKPEANGAAAPAATTKATGKRKLDINAAVRRGLAVGDDGKLEKERFTRSGRRRGSMRDVYANDDLTEEEKSRYIGLDCEMVGIGPTGRQSILARCCLVNYDGEIIYDRFIKPKSFVTDFRTDVSGVLPKHVLGKGAIPLEDCQREVAQLIRDKIVIGHALKNDLHALLLTHPKYLIRDTARYVPLMRARGVGGGRLRPRRLKDLAKEHLNIDIQTGEHDPGEDARTAVFLYRKFRKEWERELALASQVGRGAGRKAKRVKLASSAGDDEGEGGDGARRGGAAEDDDLEDDDDDDFSDV